MSEEPKMPKLSDLSIESLVQFVFDKATRGDTESFIKTVDAFPLELMIIGEEKGLIMENLIAQNKPKVLAELGAYFGYSAIRLAHAARKYNPDAHFYSIELNPVLACVTETLVRYAGLEDAITVLPGTLAKNTAFLKQDIQKRFGRTELDFLLLDHWKSQYIPDLQLAQKEGFFKKGSAIVADNIVRPGAPEYKKYVESETGLYTSIFQETSDDAILIAYVN